jgi:hypothetical protein
MRTMESTGTEDGTRPDDTVEMDPGWLLPRGLPREILAADAAAYARIQAHSVSVMVEAFTVAVVCDPDLPIPYMFSLMGWTATELPESQQP